MDDILRAIIALDKQNSREVLEYKEFIADLEEERDFAEKKLQETRNYYAKLLAMSQAEYPPDNDEIYDYMIGKYSDIYLPEPPSFSKLEYGLLSPMPYWLRDHTDKSFQELPREEQIRLIRMLTTEKRQNTLDDNVRLQLKYDQEVQNTTKQLKYWESKLDKKEKEEKERVFAIAQALNRF